MSGPIAKVVAGAVVARQVPADLRRAGGEIEAPERGVALHRRHARHRGQLAGPQRVGGGIRQHAEEEGAGAFGAGVDELLGGGRAGAHLVDEGRAGAADDQHAARRHGQAFRLRFRVGDQDVSGGRGVRKARHQSNASGKPQAVRNTHDQISLGVWR